jgi:hypothetical protein
MKGKLTIEQILPIVMGVAGAAIMLRGSFFLGLVAIFVAIAWHRGTQKRLLGSKNQQDSQFDTDKARLLLGVSRFDNAARIRERHRTLIAQNHPDTGGNEVRARELNEARDHLLNELEKHSR